MITLEEIKNHLIESGKVQFTLTAEEEDTTPEEQLLKYSDPEYEELDKKMIRSIKASLSRGNDWAWCVAALRAEFRGLTSTDYLGGCSYKNENDFIKNSSYYDDMKETVLNELAEQIQAIVVNLNLTLSISV